MNMRKCFVIMALNKKLDSVYTGAIKEAATNCGCECTRADIRLGADDIPDTIIKSIMQADFVIADLTFPKPNVYFELGIAYSITQPTICISQTLNLPFDVRNYRIIKYKNDDLVALRLRLEEAIKNVESYKDNPVMRIGKPYFDLRGKIEDNLKQVISERNRTKEYLEFTLKHWSDNTPVAEKLIENMWERFPLDRKDKILIAISGAGSIGKSTFSHLLKHRLTKHLPKKSVEILPTDAYMMNRPDRLSKNVTGFDITAHDLLKFENDIEKLMKGENVIVAPYDHATGYHTTEINISSPDILILEGIHSFHPPIYKFIKYSTFIYAEKSHVKELKFLADFLSRGYTASESFKHSEREYLDYDEHVLPYYKQANSVMYVDGYWRYRLGGIEGKYQNKRGRP